MYDSESRGNRILESCALAPDLQRLVLVGAGNSLEYEKITESLCLQFPDFKPNPVVWQTGGAPRGQHSSASTTGSGSSSSGSFRTSSASSKGKPSSGNSSKPFSHGKGHAGKGPLRNVFQTETAEAEADEADGDEDDEHQDAEDGDAALDTIPRRETQNKMKKEMTILLHVTLRHLQRWHMC